MELKEKKFDDIPDIHNMKEELSNIILRPPAVFLKVACSLAQIAHHSREVGRKVFLMMMYAN